VGGVMAVLMALTPLKTGARLRGGLRRGGGMMAGRVTARAASKGGVGQRGVAGGDEERRQRSAGVGKGMELTGGPHMVVTCEREGVSARVRKDKENMPFGKYANAAWAESAEWGASSLRGIVGRRGRGWAGWAEIQRKFLFK
jgi:hypothetical protein